jgi:ATP-dependent protease Clp ATPase subunit
VIVLLVGAAGVYWTHLASTRPRMWTFPRALVLATMVLATVGAVGSLVEVALIGHSGAAAAWSGTA